METDFLSLEEVLEIHEDQITRYGGEPGIRDVGLLESSIAMPRAGIGDRFFHADLIEMAAAYVFHIVANHPFVDGNKRTGVVAALVFLSMNGVKVEADESELEKLAWKVAEGKSGKEDIAEFFRKNAKVG